MRHKLANSEIFSKWGRRPRNIDGSRITIVRSRTRVVRRVFLLPKLAQTKLDAQWLWMALGVLLWKVVRSVAFVKSKIGEFCWRHLFQVRPRLLQNKIECLPTGGPGWGKTCYFGFSKTNYSSVQTLFWEAERSSVGAGYILNPFHPTGPYLPQFIILVNSIMLFYTLKCSFDCSLLWTRWEIWVAIELRS